MAARLAHSSVRTHAIRGKHQAAALCWDDIVQQARDDKSTGVN